MVSIFRLGRRARATLSLSDTSEIAMHASVPTRTAAEVLVDQLVAHGVEHVFCVPGESYLAVLDAFHDRSIQVTVCRQEGGAAMMADAVGKATGRPRRMLRHARAGRHQRDGRHPCRPAGFLADDHVRRSGRARHARPRGVPGDRLSRRLRPHDEMDRRDRRCHAHPRDGLARLSYGDERSRRPRGAEPARRHADRAGDSGGCAAAGDDRNRGRRPRTWTRCARCWSPQSVRW